MSENKKKRPEIMKIETGEDSTLAEILFEIGKSQRKGNPESLLDLFSEDGNEKQKADVPLNMCPSSSYSVHSFSWLAKLDMDEVDLSIISYLWYKHLEGSFRNDVSELLKRVFENPVQAYKQIDRVRTLLKKGIIVEDSDASSYNPFMPFITAQNDQELYKMDVCIGQSMVDFITDKTEQFTPFCETPFTSDDEYIQAWIHLWKTAMKLYKSDSKKYVFGQIWKPESNAKFAEILACLRHKEDCTKIPLRFRTFCTRYKLTDEEILLFIMILNHSQVDAGDIFSRAFEGDLDEYYEMHRAILGKISKSKLIKHDILFYTSSDPEIEKPAVYGYLSIRPWVKQELAGIPASDKKVKKHTDDVLLQQLNSESKLFDLVKPNHRLEDIIITPELSDALKRVVNFKQDSTLTKLSQWGVEGFSQKQHRGYTALFHGGPGTGKTLAAEVVAAETGKQILKTDSALILSKYFGEAERNAKRMFEQYYELCDKMQNPPILLFNEADQLLNKRRADTGQGTDKAWNALQNIFLEALEQPKGIIIATTNLISCMDTAYSRRFDIILEFPPPGEAERHSIWKVRRPGKLPGLATLDISRLAHYDLTGGQITKVIRNACLHLASGVSKSKKITTELLVSFCEQEKKQSFETRQNKPATIGFS